MVCVCLAIQKGSVLKKTINTAIQLSNWKKAMLNDTIGARGKIKQQV